MEVQELASLIQTGLKDLATRIDDTNARIVDTQTVVHNGFKQVDARLGQVDACLGQVDARLGQVDARLGQVEHSVGGLEKDMRITLIKVEGLHHKTDLLDEGIRNLDEKLDRHTAENNRQFDEVRGILRLI